MRRNFVLRLIGAVVALVVTASGASATQSGAAYSVVDAKAASSGVDRLGQLSHDPTIPARARAGLVDLLEKAQRQRIRVTAPEPALVARGGRQPSWSSVRLAADVNGSTYVIDRSADFRRVVAAAIGSDGAMMFKADVHINPLDGGRSWSVEWRVNGGPKQTFRHNVGDAGVDCTTHCVLAGIATSLIVGLFCVIAVPAGAIAGALVCVALGVVLAGGTSYVCSATVQACDADPNRMVVQMPPPSLRCPYYSACDIEGVISTHEHNASLTYFNSHLHFWYNAYEFAFNVYDGADMGLRQTLNYPRHRAWRFSAFISMSGITNVWCTHTATLWVAVAFADGSTAATETGAPKLRRPESACPV